MTRYVHVCVTYMCIYPYINIYTCMHTYSGHAQGYMCSESFHLIPHLIHPVRSPSCGSDVLFCDFEAIFSVSCLPCPFRNLQMDSCLGFALDVQPLKKVYPGGPPFKFPCAWCLFASSQKPVSFLRLPREQHSRKEG